MLNIWTLQLHSGFTFTYPNSIGTLWAYLSTKEDIFPFLNLTGIGYRVNETVMELLPEVDKNGTPDVILVTYYNWNYAKSNKLTKAIKEKFPNVIIVAGGNEIPERHDRLEKFVRRNPQYDYLVSKEGEIPLEMIIRKILSEKDIYHSDYVNDCYTETENGQIKKMRERFRYLDHKDFLDIPSPFTMGLFDDIYEECKDLNLQAVLETNRGCPFSCTFCDWGLQEKIRKFNIKRVEEEINWMIGKADEVFISDGNFGMLDRDIEIAKYFIRAKVKHPNPRTHSLVFSHAKNNKKRVLQIAELLEKFDLGRSGATFALQSMNPDTLNAIKRQNMNITTDHDWIAQKFIENGIPYTNELILGLPLETKESFFNSLNQLLELNPLHMNTFRLQYLENSEISNEDHSEKYGLKWSKFVQTDSKYDDEKEIAYLVKETSTMPREDFLFVRKIRDFVEILWMGKLIYFIGRYLQKEYNIPACTFLIAINDWFKNNERDFWNTLLVSKEDIRDPDVEVPLWYDYKKFKFHRFVNAWIYLAIADNNKEIFYSNILQMCKNYYPEVRASIIEDLVEFNKQFVVDADMAYEKTFTSKYNWVRYFMQGTLSKEKTRYDIKIHNAGHRKISLSSGKETVLYYMAGGHDFLFNKQNCFIYNVGTCTSQTDSLNFINKLGLFYEEEMYNSTAQQIIKNISEEFPEIKEEDAFKRFLYADYDMDHNIIEKRG